MGVMTVDDIKKWLKAIGQDRKWLAAQLHATKGTVDQWFSRGFPADKIAMIEMLAQTKSTSGLEVSFTPSEWREIQSAMNNSGYTSQPKFFHDGIMCYAEKLQSEGGSSNKIAGNETTLPPKKRSA